MFIVKITLNSLWVGVYIDVTHNCFLNKRERISKGQSKIDNPEKQATWGTEDEEKQSKTHNMICVGHHNAQANTNNIIRHEPYYIQLEIKTNRTRKSERKDTHMMDNLCFIFLTMITENERKVIVCFVNMYTSCM